MTDRPITDIDGNPVVVERRGERIHIDVVDETGCQQIADLTDAEALQLARDIVDGLR